MTRKQDGWGVEGSKKKQPKIQRKRAIGGKTPPSRPFRAGRPLSWGLRGSDRRAGGPGWAQQLAGPGWAHWQPPAASWSENGWAWLWKGEGWGFLLFSEELEKTEPSPVNLARPNFLPQGEFFPALGKHTWLEFSCPGPGAPSFLPSGWSLGEIKRLADTKHFDVKNRWQERKNKH